MTPTDQALDDVAAYMATKREGVKVLRDGVAPYPAAPRSFGKREVPVFKAHTQAEVDAFAPFPFDPDKRHPSKQFDVFVRDRANPLVSGWHNISTEECAEWAWTLQNMVRKERPWLDVRVLSKPRYA